MTTNPTYPPHLRDILTRAWAIRPSLFGFLGLTIAVLAVCSLLDIPAVPVLVALALGVALVTGLTVAVAAAQLREESRGGRR
ncbi:hypothetical protein DI270_013415 [Microbispora triticiradicis]|uniref:DUF3040 domain-containing protein n=1 Tax=Microbispora triticiradicis TaxID=2200763 RepID=A0ABX9LLK1_9ACTN|nr:hypothetical protein [Microbispora triticiradicis]RGA04486.1 hypothetical protein DI270_013415 [Microbispora triticiradicis]